MSFLWHTELPEAIASQLKTDLVLGLSQQEAKYRLQTTGVNVLTHQKKYSPIVIFFRQFSSLVIWVLLSAVLISFFLGEKVDAIVILVIVILNAVIGFVLEFRSDRAMLVLQKMVAPTAAVIRDGHVTSILTSDIAPGDILILEAGDLISADARLYEVASLKTNESALTGESLPIEKNTRAYSSETALADRKNMLYMGTSIVNGTAKAIVVSTGMQTEMGKIASMLESVSQDETPLQKKLNKVGSQLLWICFSIIVIIFILGLLRHITIFKLFMSSVSLAVAAIPEGLPAIVTVALALGVQRMIRRCVLVRRLSAVETLGCIQVICTDKTGTLTVGEMTSRKLVTFEKIYTIQGEGYHFSGDFISDNHIINPSTDELLTETLRACVLCNNAQISLKDDSVSVIGDPTEIALLIAGAKANFFKEKLNQEMPRIKEIPFNSERKRMSVLCGRDKSIAYVKGAPEVILDHCTHILTSEGIKALTENDCARIQQSCALMASEALRVLALAERRFNVLLEAEDDQCEKNLVFLGLIGLQDPPHVSAKESIQQCQSAGIKPIMITGDHPETAKAIAQELGILEKNDILITGNELDKISEEDFFNQVKKISVYARVTAEHKLKIVKAWKKHEKIVAMTGDGVNDAPALKEASVGIAMGKTGTSVTKEAADLIILDNNFTSIVSGIAEGRNIYDNISKTLKYLLAGNTGELLVVFIALLIGWPLPLLAIQLLWINLITDGLPAIALATDSLQGDILNRPPRNPKKIIMDKLFFQDVLFIGILTSLLTLSIFAYEYLINHNLSQAQDAAFSVLVTAEILRAFGARSDTKTIWQIGIFSNIRLFFVVGVSFLFQIMIHHVPVLQKLFSVEEVSMSDCFLWILFGLLPLIILEITKLFRKNNAEAY